MATTSSTTSRGRHGGALQQHGQPATQRPWDRVHDNGSDRGARVAQDGQEEDDDDDDDDDDEVTTEMFEVALGGALGATPWATAFLEAASEGDLSSVVQLLDEAKVELNDVDVDGFTALMIAAAEARTEVAMELLRRGADVSIRTHELRSTALHFAAKSGDAGLVAAICEQDPQGVDVQNYDGDTPLVWACTEGRPEAVRVLLGFGADVNTLSHRAMSTLICATMLRDEHEDDASATAADRDRATIIRLLLDANPKLVNYQDRDGSTAMHLATAHGYLACVQALLERGADITLRNAIGQTPLEEAQETGVPASAPCVEHLRGIWKRLEDEAAARMRSMLELEESGASAAAGVVPGRGKRAKKKHKKAKRRGAGGAGAGGGGGGGGNAGGSSSSTITTTTTGATTTTSPGDAAHSSDSAHSSDDEDAKTTRSTVASEDRGESQRQAGENADEAADDDDADDDERHLHEEEEEDDDEDESAGVWTTVGRKHRITEPPAPPPSSSSLEAAAEALPSQQQQQQQQQPRDGSAVDRHAATTGSHDTRDQAREQTRRGAASPTKVTPMSPRRPAPSARQEAAAMHALPPPPPPAEVGSPFTTFQTTNRLYERYATLSALDRQQQQQQQQQRLTGPLPTWRGGSSSSYMNPNRLVPPSPSLASSIWRNAPATDRGGPALASTSAAAEAALGLLACGLCGAPASDNAQCAEGRCLQLYCVPCLARALGLHAGALKCVRCRQLLDPKRMQRNALAAAQAQALVGPAAGALGGAQQLTIDEMTRRLRAADERVAAAELHPFYLTPGAELSVLSEGQLEVLEALHQRALAEITTARLEHARTQERLRIEEWLRTQRDLLHYGPAVVGGQQQQQQQ